MSRARHVITAFVLSVAAPVAQQVRDASPTAVLEGLARTVYITAVDGKGAPATDLTPAEVIVREDGKVRDVLTIGPATDPMQVVILADDSGPGIQHIREGVASFVRILQNRAEMAIVSTGGRNTLVADFTASPDELMTAINRGLVTRSTTGAYLLDGIQESARTLVRREAARPAIVVLTLEGPEFSNVQKSQVLEAVRQSGAILHVVSVGKPTLKTMTSWNQRPTDSIHEALDEGMTRSAFMAEGPRMSGGRLEQVVEFTGIASRMSEIAYDLRDQLAITYVRPQSGGAPTKIEVSVKRRGVKVRAPRQVK